MIQETIPKLDNRLELHREHFDIVRVIKRKKSSFLSEMCAEIGISEYNLRTTLYALKEQGIVQNIEPDFWNPQWQLKSRVPEMSRKNQGGYPAFCQKRWFILTEKGNSIADKVEV